jgi:hypothetical protein
MIAGLMGAFLQLDQSRYSAIVFICMAPGSTSGTVSAVNLWFWLMWHGGLKHLTPLRSRLKGVKWRQQQQQQQQQQQGSAT